MTGGAESGTEVSGAALRRRRADLHTILRHVAVTIVVFDRAGTITSFEAYGSAREERGSDCVGRAVGAAYSEVPHLDEAVAHLLSGGETAFQLTRHGRTWDVRLGPVHGSDGTVEAGVAVAMDVTATVHEATRLEVSERRFRVLTERSAELALLAEPDGTLTFVSAAAPAMLGYEPDEVVGRNGFELVHPEDHERVLAAYERAVGGEDGGAPVEFRLLHADGSWRWVEQTYTNLLDDPVIGCMASNLRDITTRKLSESALAASEERYRTIVESAQEGIWMVDVDFRTTFANPRMAELLRVEPAALLGRPMLDFFFAEDHEGVRRALPARRAGASRSDEVRYRQADGEELWAHVVSSQVVGDDGVLSGFVGMVTDITEGRAAALRIERWALHDELTGLPTRRHFELELERLEAEGVTAGCAVLMIGVDGMKDINGTVGQPGGDHVLREVGRRLLEDESALATARSSGDEFLVLVEAEGERDALDAMCGVRRLLAPLVAVDHHQIALSTSFGIAPVGTTSGPGSSCATPRRRCTRRSGTARAGPSCSTTICAGLPPSASPSRPGCGAPSAQASSRCTTNRSTSSPRAVSPAARRWCAGATRSGASCRPPASSRSRRSPT